MGSIATAFISERGIVPRKFIQEALTASSVECVIAKTESELLSELSAVRPALIFLQASVIDDLPAGILGTIKETPGLGDAFIIVHAARAEGMEFAARVGADRFLPIPFRTEQINSILRQVLNLPKLILLCGSACGENSSLSLTLSKSQFSLIYCDNAAEAFSVAAAAVPDLIIAHDKDQKPCISLATALRDDRTLDHIPLLVLEDGADAATAEALFDAGVHSIIDSPWDGQRALQQITEIAAPPKKGRKRRALVVDDSPMIRNIITKMFKQLGYLVSSAENGQEGLEVALRDAPDVITSDYDMPVMNGWDFITALKKNPQLREIPVVLVTTRGTDTDRKKGQLLGVADYLPKPFKEEELKEIISRVLADARRRLEEAAIAKYVARDAISNVDDIIEGIKAREPEQKFISIFFSDICSFTPKCEKHSAAEIIRLLNAYFNEMISILVSEEAIIDKLIGDAIVARFDSGDRKTDALHAVRGAWKCLDRLRQFNTEIKSLVGIDETVECRIGLNSGEVILGNLGCETFRLDYTMIGDNVNLTQRLEANAPAMSALMSSATYELVKEFVVTGEKKEIKVKGKTVPVVCYVLKGLKDLPASSWKTPA